jgi:hypothetical protein
MFSIEQTTTKLSLWSRMTSSSNSFQPWIDSSTRTSPMRESFSPSAAIAFISSMVWAMPEPPPPSVKEARTTTGRPISSVAAMASSIE